MARVIIIGGGIAGLSAAYYLSKAGLHPLLLERQPRLGGVVTTEVVEGCCIEGGPDSFLAAKPWAMDLIRELGLASEVIGSNDHLRATYIWKNSRLIPLPDGLMLMVPTRVMPMVTTPLLGWGTKIRMGLEWFRRNRPAGGEDRSVAEFIEDHYGREAVEYLAEPLLAGVYGGDPDQLSVGSVLTKFVELEQAFGSLTRGVLAERRRMSRPAGGQSTLFRTLKRGLGHLVSELERRLAGKAEIRHVEADTIERHGQQFRVRAGSEWLESSHLVLACPAYEAGRLVGNVDGELGRTLGAIPYASSMTVALGYRRESLGHPLNGFGFLVPARHRRRLVACTWVGTKFSHRVPASHAVLRCFLGGIGDEAVLSEPDESAVRAVREELRAIMGVTAEPVFARIHRWPRSMAQYTVGHQARLDRIEERRRHVRNLHLAGNAYSGIGVPDCIRSGKAAAEAIAAQAREP